MKKINDSGIFTLSLSADDVNQLEACLTLYVSEMERLGIPLDKMPRVRSLLIRISKL